MMKISYIYMRNAKYIIISFLSWRMFLILPIIISVFLFQQENTKLWVDSFIPYRSGYGYTYTLIAGDTPSDIISKVFAPWANFDGIHYLSIASRGYIDEGRFFPLYPFTVGLLNKGLSLILEPNFSLLLSGLLVSNISLITALITFKKLIQLDYLEKISNLSILFLLIFPASFFLGSVYSESLFLFLSLLSFYFSRRQRWFLACLCGLLLAVTRLPGIFILPALLYELLLQDRVSGFTAIKNKVFNLLPFALIPVGLIGFIIFNTQKWGDPLYFLHAHGQLANSRATDTIILFPQTIFRYFKILLDLPVIQYEWMVAVLEISSFFFASALLYLGWKQKIRRSYLIFSVLVFLLPVSSGTFSGLPRYILILFPVFIALAGIKNSTLKIVYLILSPLLLFLLTMVFLRGYFVA